MSGQTSLGISSTSVIILLLLYVGSYFIVRAMYLSDALTLGGVEIVPPSLVFSTESNSDVVLFYCYYPALLVEKQCIGTGFGIYKLVSDAEVTSGIANDFPTWVVPTSP